jgi:hypothetical protein
MSREERFGIAPRRGGVQQQHCSAGSTQMARIVMIYHDKQISLNNHNDLFSSYKVI